MSSNRQQRQVFHVKHPPVAVRLARDQSGCFCAHPPGRNTGDCPAVGPVVRYERLWGIYVCHPIFRVDGGCRLYEGVAPRRRRV